MTNCERKRILIVSCEGMGRGGVQAVFMSIVRNFSRQYTFDILLFTSEERYHEDEFTTFGGRVYRIPKYEGKIKLLRRLDYLTFGMRIYFQTLRILSENKDYVAIHCHNEFEAAPCLKAAKKAKTQLRIAHAHVKHCASKYRTVQFIQSQYRKSILKYSTHMIGCSEEACASLYGHGADYSVVSNPVDKRFTTNHDIDKSQMPFTLIQVGRYEPNKNQLFSIDVFSCIMRRSPNSELRLVGSGEDDYLQEMKKMIDKFGISDHVSFLPDHSDIPKQLSSAHAMIFPSVAEGFGLVVVEAQAMGVRCYASDTVPRATDCGGCKYLSLSSAPNEWAEVIMSDYETYKNEQTSFDCSSFDEDKVMKTYNAIYSGNRM